MAIKIEALRCFSVVAQTGNLAEAAVRLSRTQSALSMTLKQLEEHLGQRLFESDRKSRLTLLGEQVFELAQQQLRQFDDTVAAIETSARAPAGMLRIASIPSVARLVFPTAIEQLTRQYPRLKIELRDTDTQGVVNELTQGRADMGIASGHHALHGIKQIPLFEDQFGLICSPDNPLAKQRKAPTIAEVMASKFIRNNLCELLVSEDCKLALLDAKVTIHNTLSLVGMVRASRWTTILPENVVQILPGELTFRHIADLHDRRPVYVLLKENSPYIQYAEQMTDFVCAHSFLKNTANAI